MNEALSRSAAILSLNYLLPLICGYLFDKVPFVRQNARSLVGSSAVMSILFINAGPDSFDYFISIILVVSGFLRAAIPVWIKSQPLERHDESLAFTKMYTAFNWGTTLGTIVIAILGEMIGWNFCFSLTALSLFLMTFLIPEQKPWSLSQVLPTLLIIPVVFAVKSLLNFAFLGETLFVLLLASFIFLFEHFRRRQKNFLVIWGGFVFLILSHALFFAIYEQATMSYISVVIAKLSSMGASLPATSFQLLDPILNVLVGSLLAKFLANERYSKWISGTQWRFALGFVILLPGLALLRAGTLQTGLPLFAGSFIAASLFFVLSEQLIIPAGFAKASSVATSDSQATFMGIWYLGIAFSEQISGQIGKLLAGGEQLNPLHYQNGLNYLLIISSLLALTHLTLSLRRTGWMSEF